MTKTLRVSHANEILSLVPYQLGFEPENSLVLISLRGERNRVGLIARANLDDVLDPGSPVIEALVDHALRDGASSVVVAIYVECTGDFAQDSAAQATVREVLDLTSRGTEGNLDITEAWIVTAGQYSHWIFPGVHASSTCVPAVGGVRGTTCTAHAGTTDDFRNSQISAHMVLEGKNFARSRDQVGIIEEASPSVRKAVFDSYLRETQAARHNTTHSEFAQYRSETIELLIAQVGLEDGCSCEGIRAKTARPPLTPKDIGRIAAGLEDLAIRDSFIILISSLGNAGARRHIMLANALRREALNCGTYGGEMISFEGELVAREVLEEEVDMLARNAVGVIVDPALAMTPHECTLNAALELLTALLSAAPVNTHSAPRALAALSEWWRGNSAVAHRHVAEGLKHDPNYGLLGLVRSALENGLAPGWRRREQILGGFATSMEAI